jgi:hypothetical protein
MSEESTNTGIVTRTNAANQDASVSSAPDWKPRMKPRGYSLSVGQRRTRAMLPTRDRISLKLDIPAWHNLYGEALLETDAEILLKLLAAAEMAVFERLLELAELATNEEGSHERQDIRRAIDVMLTLKTQARSRISLGWPKQECTRRKL